MKVKKNTNYDYFIKADTSSYKGEWVAISGKKIVSHGKDAQDVYQKAQKITRGGNISLAKIPEEQVLVLKLCK